MTNGDSAAGATTTGMYDTIENWTRCLQDDKENVEFFTSPTIVRHNGDNFVGVQQIPAAEPFHNLPHIANTTLRCIDYMSYDHTRQFSQP